MAYAPHYLVSFGGALDPQADGSWNEVWQCGIRGLFETDIVTPDVWLAGRGTALATWFGTASNKMHPLSRLEWIKCNGIGPDGKYVDPTHPHTYSVVPTIGASADRSNNIDSSACWSWTTANLRGRAHTGRIYMPTGCNVPALGAQVMTVAGQTGMVTAAKALLTLLHTTEGDHTFTPGVFSKVDASHLDITGVRVGRVIDVQRRRRNKITENYASSVWP